MTFSIVNYECDDGTIGKIRLSDLKLALAGTAPGGTPERNLEIIATPSGRTRRFGVFARGVYGSNKVVNAGRSSIKRVFIPCLTPASLTELLGGTDFTYDGLVYTNLKSVPEN